MAVKRTSIGNIVLVYLAAGLLGWGVVYLWERPLTSWATVAIFAVIGAYLLWRGFAVRRMVAGKETSMTPLAAAQVLAWAKASALFAAILGGPGFGSAIVYIPMFSSPTGRDNVLSGLVVGVVSIAVVVIALVVERWCENPTDGDEKPGHGSAAGAGA